jgi:hypothetical protein
MPKLRRGSHPTPHDVPIPCRANGRNYESVTSLRTRQENPARFRSIRVARGLRCLSLLWERGGGAQYVGACQGVCVAAGWGPDGRRGRRDGEGAEGFRGESLCVVAEWLLGLVSGGTGSWMSRPQAALRSSCGVLWGGNKSKIDRDRWTCLPRLLCWLIRRSVRECRRALCGRRISSQAPRTRYRPRSRGPRPACRPFAWWSDLFGCGRQAADVASPLSSAFSAAHGRWGEPAHPRPSLDSTNPRPRGVRVAAPARDTCVSAPPGW